MSKIEIIIKDNRRIIEIEAGIRYIGDWTDFDLDLFGHGPYIVDKQIPGCGFTEYCLTNRHNIILTSPRKLLLGNKEEQHPGDVLYVKNELKPETDPGVDKDILKPTRGKQYLEFEEDKKEDLERTLLIKEQMYKKVKDYCDMVIANGKPMKIIVTYDSFHYVREFLEKMEDEGYPGLFSTFKVVVDEFQSIFVDSRFKASTEFDFLNELKTIYNDVCFVSATPMMDKYLKQLDYFKFLPYYELDWGAKDLSRVMKPELKVRKVRSIGSEVKRVVQSYLKGNFAVLANPMTGLPVESKEAVIYLNSVNDVLNNIKATGLTPDQVNILCADTPQNQARVKRKLGSKFKIGRVPLKGEPHKMFTFCTRTVYLGADFYSTCARTFIFSNANIDSLAVDISLDLPQILGRQRLVENPWKNHAEFYFKALGEGKEITEDDFKKHVADKIERTNAYLSTFYNEKNELSKKVLIEKALDSIAFKNYAGDYISVNVDKSTKHSVVVLNNLVHIAEQRAYDIQQIDYRNRFTVFNSIYQNQGFNMGKIDKFILELRNTSIPFPKRLQLLCETSEFTEDEKKMIAQQASEAFDKYYNIVGPERCKSLGYNVTRIKLEISNLSVTPDKIFREFCKRFEVGKRYLVSETKTIIKEIYTTLGYNKNPKANELEEFYNIKRTKLKDPTGNWVSGLEILSIKTITEIGYDLFKDELGV